MPLVVSDPEPVRRHLLTIGTATYQPGWQPIAEEVKAELQKARELFIERLGYDQNTYQEIVDPNESFAKKVADWFDSIPWTAADLAVVYYTGHGVTQGSQLRLITSNIALDRRYTAIPATELVSWILGGDAIRC